MTIRARLFVVLCVLLGAFGMALLALRRAEQDHIRRVIESMRADGRQQLARWADIAGLPLRQFVHDHASWRETVAALEHFNPEWARRNLEDNLPAYGLDAVWLLRLDGTPVHLAQRDPRAPSPALPAGEELARLEKRGGRLEFFAENAAGLWQISGAPVPGETGDGGWLFAARLWDMTQLVRLGGLSESQVTLAAINEPAPPETVHSTTLTRSLNDWQGRPLRLLHMEQSIPDLTGSIEWDGYVLQLFVVFGLALVLAMVFSIRLWVLQPLDAIGRSLARQDAEPIAPLLRRDNEFTHVARLVESSFADRQALEREIAERKKAEAELRTSREDLRHSLELRARLARDLHDTVIQSIYAAGLGLESVRAQMSEDPFGAEGRIRHCMQSLNDTIRQVRSYINDLEFHPAAPRQPFPQAVRALVSTMQSLWPVEITLRIDDAAAASLGDAREVHALQIVRECISNALRHGAATRIEISLQRDPPEAVLEVRDNGRGFDPARRAGSGRGLLNLNARAQEMGGTVRIHSAEGAGATVTLRLPSSEATV
jgi:signal transduction histidine kinase